MPSLLSIVIIRPRSGHDKVGRVRGFQDYEAKSHQALCSDLFNNSWNDARDGSSQERFSMVRRDGTPGSCGY